MIYVTQDYYNSAYQGESVETTDFPSLLQRASEIVEEMTMYRLTSVTFAAMPAALQEKVKMAVCAQIEYLDANGGSDMDNGVDMQSAALGKFSYSKASGAGSNSSSGQSVYAPRARRILMPTGLLYRGGGCY